jgi:hypothetical protein
LLKDQKIKVQGQVSSRIEDVSSVR